MYIEYRYWCPSYPYAIKDSWGQTFETDKEGLEELLKEIQKVLDNPDEV